MKNLSLITAALLLSICTLTQCTNAAAKYPIDTEGYIVLPQPQRPAGANHVLELRCDPIPVVRVGIIGLGMRGPGAIQRMCHIPNVEIAALCDMNQESITKVNDKLEAMGRARAKEFFGSTESWRELTAMPDLDLVYVVTPWDTHATIGIQAMKDGKHVAIEVPAAMTLDEIWGLVNTSEQTRKHCIQLENCVYDFFELTSLNMAQQGLFGEVLYAEGAYIHNLEPFWKDYWNDWRLEYNIKHFGDLYPTHGLGPVCQAMNIHRGDKMNFLVSMQTKTVSIPEFIKRTQGRDVSKDFRNGDHTVTLIHTEKGKMINIQHNVATPRPYDRMYQLTGTKGFANKYPVQGYAFDAPKFDSTLVQNHEKLDGHSFVSDKLKTQLMQAYKHPIHVELEATAKKVGGHGGMDYIMDYRLIYCLQNGLPLDMDVYDLAEWCCLIPLTAISIESGSKPVRIPDFTRGNWDKLKALKFAVKE
ncbi:MAG: Gfo/Idh/MocA family protein [Bacteroidales bacterium]